MYLQIAEMASLMGLFFLVPIFVRYFWLTELSGWTKLGGALMCALAAVLPLLVAREWTFFYGRFFKMAETVGFFVFILAFLLIFFTGIRDVIWFLGWMMHKFPSPMDWQVVKTANLITLVLALVCNFWALYEGLRVPAIKEVERASEKILAPKKVVLLTDLHLNRVLSVDKIKGIVSKVNAEAPDAVLMVGDVVDDQVPFVAEHLKALSQLKAKQGVYFVSGNHEFYVGYKAAMQALKQAGFTSLENKTVTLEPDLAVAGIPDGQGVRFGVPNKGAALLDEVPDKAYTILMSHRPTKLDWPFDLEVSGHTHGGQIFPFHFLTWLGNNHFLAGFYPKDKIYVSRGSGQWGPPLRFLSPAEITVLNLKPKKIKD